MKLNEILQEQTIEEGPLLNKIGTGIGNVVGGVAKAAGAVAGGIAGLGAAAKKGFQAGKQTVAGAGDEPAGGSTAAPAATGGAAPAAPSAGGAQTQTLSNPKNSNTGTPTAASAGGPPKSDTPFGRLAQAAAGQDPDAAEKPAAGAAQSQATAEKPTAAVGQEKPAAAARAQTGTMKGAPGKPNFQGAPAGPGTADSQGRVEPTMGTAAPANDPEFQKVQQNIGKLPPEQQKELMAALMADPSVKEKLAAAEKPQAQPETPAAQAQTPAAQPETPAAAADQTAVAKPARQRDAQGRFIGKNPAAANAKPTQAEIDADRARLGVGGSESIVRKGKTISENSTSHSDRMIAAYRGFQRGLANPFAGPGNDSAETPTNTGSKTIIDKTGTMPVDLINRVNQLESAEKRQLFKFLKAKQ